MNANEIQEALALKQLYREALEEIAAYCENWHYNAAEQALYALNRAKLALEWERVHEVTAP